MTSLLASSISQRLSITSNKPSGVLVSKVPKSSTTHYDALRAVFSPLKAAASCLCPPSLYHQAARAVYSTDHKNSNSPLRNPINHPTSTPPNHPTHPILAEYFPLARILSP